MSGQNKYSGVMTTAVHAGEAPDPSTLASAPPLHMSSTFVSEEAAGFSAHDLTEDSPWLYARWGNPTVAMLERKIAALEGVEDCLCLASGMAAASAIFLTFLSAGNHAIISDVSYAGVAELGRDTLPRFGIEVDFVDMSDLAALAAAVRPNTKLIHTETPVNPIMRLTDLAKVKEIAVQAGALLSSDCTFATPIGTRAADLGVDLIMHSATKYIGGHGDALGGAVAGTRELIGKLRLEAGIHHGGVMSPFNAWLINRGLSTLPLRMRAHQEGAMAVATWLQDHPRVTKVLYPGLASHPQYDLAQSQMKNTSAMLSFQVGDAATGQALAEKMTKSFSFVHYAVSLGHHRSLVFWMPSEDLISGSFRLEGKQAESYRSFAGDGIFRMSVGLEDAADIIADLDAVL
jgi:cystathionine beta-lyase/cystathionine gamma-synthase